MWEAPAAPQVRLHRLQPSNLLRLRGHRRKGTLTRKQHRGHKIENRADRLPELPRGKLRESLLTIEECILKDHTRKQELVLEREVLRSELRWNRNKLREYYEEMSARLELEADRLMKELESEIAERGGRLEKLKRWKEEIGQVIELKDLSLGELEKLDPRNGMMRWLQEE